MPGNSRFRVVRHAMLEHLLERGITSPGVLTAMGRVPRERFVAPELSALAYADRAVPIGCEQTISQPYIVALMTEALRLSGTERMLEIGTGSGYQTAILAELSQSVVSLERHADLSRLAQRRLDQCGYQNLTLVVGDGTQGWPQRAPYERILVAAAADFIPPALVEQLSEGGILVIPLGGSSGQTLQAFSKSLGQLHSHSLTSCRFVPLVGAQAKSP